MIRPPHSGRDAIRVLHFGRFWDDNFGGLERHVMILVQELCRREGIHADNVVASRDRNTEVLEIPNTGPDSAYHVHRVGSLGTLSSTAISPKMPFYVRRLFKEHGYNIAHLHFPDPLSTLCAYFLPQDVPIVISWHGDIIRPMQKRFLALTRPFFDTILRRAKFLIAGTPGHFTSSTQMQAVAEDRKTLVPYGLYLEEFAGTPAIETAAQKIRTEHGNRRLIFAVGRHIYYKGFPYLVRAMRDLAEMLRARGEDPDGVRLLLGGRGPLSDELKATARELGVEDRIVFLGRVPEEELPHYYHACDVFCMPSVEQGEAFGLVQVEAMSCYKPVVCCELHNGVTYVNRHNETGLVVPPRDPRALAEALTTLLTDKKLRLKLGRQAYKRVWSEFTAKNMTDTMIEVYRKVLR